MELFATSAARELLGAVTNDDGLDRRVDLRTDPQQLSEIFANPAARFVVVNNSKMLFSSETSLGLLTKVRKRREVAERSDKLGMQLFSL